MEKNIFLYRLWLCLHGVFFKFDLIWTSNGIFFSRGNANQDGRELNIMHRTRWFQSLVEESCCSNLVNITSQTCFSDDGLPTPQPLLTAWEFSPQFLIHSNTIAVKGACYDRTKKRKTMLSIQRCTQTLLMTSGMLT